MRPAKTSVSETERFTKIRGKQVNNLNCSIICLQYLNGMSGKTLFYKHNKMNHKIMHNMLPHFQVVKLRKCLHQRQENRLQPSKDYFLKTVQDNTEENLKDT